jgi:hypothetical protein
MAWPTGSARRRWRIVGVLACVIALGITAACSGSGAQWSPGATSSDGGGTTSAPADSQFTVVPAADAKDVSPAEPVTVQLSGGTLDTVTLTNPDGKVVKGDYASDKASWQTSEELGYNKRYTLKATGNSAGGQHVEFTRTFTTVKPRNLTLPYLRANVGTLLDGGTFGVGQPIVVWYDEEIKDKAAAEK